MVITEHDVRPGSRRSWERDADVLVSLTKAGVAALRAQWPDKRVEWIEHGCPTWFPPRKRTRGRTIGAFGFLDWYKGFWRLLDVLRDVPGTDLLLISHPRTMQQREAAAAWWAAAQGLPVRWVSDYLPVEEVASRLAAEADVLAFYYEDIPHECASGAARVGLATGVPVLASKTRWFAELGETVYRADDLAEGVARLLDDTSLRRHVTAAAREYCDALSWSRIAARHAALWHELAADD